MPARRPGRVSTRGRLMAGLIAGTTDAVRPASREETMPVGLAALALGFIALWISSIHGYMLMYGDAVAHLGTARRIVDSRNPGLQQLGGVWLPLPHLLMTPFIGRMEWWQTGMAGAWPSLLCYILGVMGFYRLCRRMMTGRWSLIATGFYATNPNLLYLATTAMTEPLFLALLIWIVLLTLECIAALKAGAEKLVARRFVFLGILNLFAVMTRYDGWILAAAVWLVLAIQLARSGQFSRYTRSFATFTLLTVAGPLAWFWYNQHYFHDWLDFMRGPYSAVAIDRKTSPPGSQHYWGWHHPFKALVFYTRTAQVDAVWWELGFAAMVAAVAGLYRTLRDKVEMGSLLLWLPLPFYVYSVSYGSVPIFIPQLYPHAYYNSRYGMEMLPALALFGVFAVEWLQERFNLAQPLVARLMPPLAMGFIALNAIGMIHATPLVLKEAMVNSITRMAFERSLADQLVALPPAVPILMQESDHIGALQQAGIPLRRTINETDWDSWSAALADPAGKAAFVIAFTDGPVAKAVKDHPGGLTETMVLCTQGQTCARIYKSDKYGK
ncbi:ArnT family glycosyltransferase [Granulicella rosea]|nr:glycosyltransferase family 39 protein [Granulicella rosea]